MNVNAAHNDNCEDLTVDFGFGLTERILALKC